MGLKNFGKGLGNLALGALLVTGGAVAIKKGLGRAFKGREQVMTLGNPDPEELKWIERGKIPNN